jgi:hypothetical protein
MDEHGVSGKRGLNSNEVKTDPTTLGRKFAALTKEQLDSALAARLALKARSRVYVLMFAILNAFAGL